VASLLGGGVNDVWAWAVLDRVVPEVVHAKADGGIAGAAMGLSATGRVSVRPLQHVQKEARLRRPRCGVHCPHALAASCIQGSFTTPNRVMPLIYCCATSDRRCEANKRKHLPELLVWFRLTYVFPFF